MKQVLIQRGGAVVREMPAPGCGDGEVLVRVAYSLISTGTETATLQGSARAPAGVWSRRLGKIGEVLRLASERGVSTAVDVVRDRVQGPCAVTGYSLAGTVLQVGGAVRDLVPGQRVACAGAASAHHAEIVAVPRNLVVPVPENLPLEKAAFVTLGAIALHAVRQADLRLGEVAFVMGLGLLGRLSAVLLRASGCRVLGSDAAAARAEAASALGVERGFVAARDDVERAVVEATAGRGVDAVLVTAGTSSSEPVRQAVRLVRSRGRVVVVGGVGMHLDRDAVYEREAEIRIARSYGPGRYDPSYERDGHDYPFDHVRWTENRNMEEFLRLAATPAIPEEAVAAETFPVDRAGEAYDRLARDDAGRPFAALLAYPDTGDEAAAGPVERKVTVVARGSRRGGVRVALVGPGSFASEVHLPNLASLAPSATLRAVVGRTGNAARELARRWSAIYACTDLEKVVRDPEIDLVLICTRHDLHAEQATRALEGGKAVFLEKPAALHREELDGLASTLRASGNAFVVGFNRRFAPDVIALRDRLQARQGPLFADYRVNAGRLPARHWAAGPEGGGRLVGEACHMIDLLGHLVGRTRTSHRLVTMVPPAGRDDLPLGDNFSLVCRYGDGSVASLTYTALGHPGAGKERLEVHWDGRTAILEDFRGLTVDGAAVGEPRERPDKGHRELLGRFVEHVAGRTGPPIDWSEIEDVSRFVLELDAEARGSPPVD